MDVLTRKVRAARRRLVMQQFYKVLAWCLTGSLAAAVAAIVAMKVWPIAGVDPTTWQLAWIGGSAGAGLLLAVVLTWLTRRDALTAAIELDRRFGLRERASSSLSLSSVERDSDVGRALVADAARRVERVEVGERFSLAPPRVAWLPLAPFAAAFLAAFFISPRGEGEADAAAKAAERQQVQTAAADLRQALAKQRKEREKEMEGLDELDGMLKDLEKGVNDLLDKQPADRKEALVKLNDLSEQLDQRRQELGSGSEKLKEQLSRMKDVFNGPAEKLAEALQNGEVKEALQQVKDLAAKLRSGDLTDEQKQQLQGQLAKMQEQLGDAAEKQKQAMEKLREQIKQAESAGQKEQAEQLREQLAEQQMAMAQMQQLQQFAAKMGECSQCMSQGEMAQAAEALDSLAEQLSEMQKLAAEMEMLEMTLDELAACKDGMCEGMNAGMLAGMQGQGQGNGMGMGEGQGQGDRPEDRTGTNEFLSRVRQNPRQGRHIALGEAEGPNRKGDVLEEIKQEFAASEAMDPDALDEQRIPKSLRGHAKDYFQQLQAEGL